MEKDAFEAYLRAFDQADYDTVLAHFVPDAEVRFAGLVLRGTDQIGAFYRFFHTYVRETIAIRTYLASDVFVALEADVRLEGLRDLTATVLQERGFPQLVPVTAGQTVILPQFIHYHLAGGRFARVTCLLET